MIDFEAQSYTTIPELDVGGLLALGTALANAVPRPLPDELRRPVKKLRAAVTALLEASAVLPKSAADREAADRRVDAAWEALHARLHAYDELPHDRYPEVIEARAIVATLFPDGLSFLTLPYNAEWVESDKRLRAIDEGAMAASLDRLAGAIFLEEARQAHAAYGEALGIATMRVSLTSAQLVGPAETPRKAVQRYARAMVGLVDEDELITVAMAETALRPLLEAREVKAAADAGDAANAAAKPSSDPLAAASSELLALASIPAPKPSTP